MLDDIIGLTGIRWTTLSVTVLRVQTTLSTRCSAPRPAMAYRSQSLDCHNSPIVLGVCSEMFYLRRTAQRNEVTTGGRSRFHFSIYRMVSQNGFQFPMAQPGGMKSMSIHFPVLLIHKSIPRTIYTQIKIPDPPTPQLKIQNHFQI